MNRETGLNYLPTGRKMVLKLNFIHVKGDIADEDAEYCI
jgi:hypothetical protein